MQDMAFTTILQGKELIRYIKILTVQMKRMLDSAVESGNYRTNQIMDNTANSKISQSCRNLS